MADKDEVPAFVLAAAPEFWWTVKVPVPRDDDYDYASLRVKYAWASQAELDKMRGVGLAEGESAPTDEQIALAKVRGFDLKDEFRNPVEFNPGTLAALLAAPMVRSAIVATYMAVMAGMGARKNARTPPAAG